MSPSQVFYVLLKTFLFSCCWWGLGLFLFFLCFVFWSINAIPNISVKKVFTVLGKKCDGCLNNMSCV